MLLGRALKPAPSAGSLRVKGEHLLQVLEHVVKESLAEAPLLKASPVAVHGVPVSLEVVVEVSLLVGLTLGVEVVVLTERVHVFEDVVEVEVEGLEVLPEVVVAPPSFVALTRRCTVTELVILSSPLIVGQRLVRWKKQTHNNLKIQINQANSYFHMVKLPSLEININSNAFNCLMTFKALPGQDVGLMSHAYPPLFL